MEGTTPPAPKIKIFLPSTLKFRSLIALVKPAMSVLCPIKLLLLKIIVFTDCVCSASGLNLSKYEITAFLNGTVTLIPFIFFLFNFRKYKF